MEQTNPQDQPHALQVSLGNVSKFVAIPIIVIVSIVFFSALLLRNSARPKASTSPAGISISPASGSTLSAGQLTSINLTVYAKMLRGLDLTITTSPELLIDSVIVGYPTNTARNQLNIRTLQKVTANRAHVMYYELDRMYDLFPVTINVKPVAAGTGSISIPRSTAKIVGNVSGDVFELPDDVTVTYGILAAAERCPTTADSSTYMNLSGKVKVNGVAAPLDLPIRAYSPRRELVGCSSTIRRSDGSIGFQDFNVYGAQGLFHGMALDEFITFEVSGQPAQTRPGPDIPWAPSPGYLDLSITTPTLAPSPTGLPVILTPTLAPTITPTPVILTPTLAPTLTFAPLPTVAPSYHTACVRLPVLSRPWYWYMYRLWSPNYGYAYVCQLQNGAGYDACQSNSDCNSSNTP